MNRSLLVLNFVLLAAIAVLFILVLGKKKTTTSTKATSDSAFNNGDFRLAYFDMDSVENNFGLWKQMQEEVNTREKAMMSELNSRQNTLQANYEKFQTDGPNMTPEQIDNARKTLTKMDMDIKNRRAELEQQYQSYFISKQQEIIGYIKDYCKELNKDHRYSLIIANEPGLIYYKDTTFNITGELLRGLNEKYKSKKASK